MAAAFGEIVNSDLFTFYVGVGKEKQAIQAHSSAIAATSKRMRAMIEGSTTENATRCAEFHVEPEDFVRFLEYAYRGDYAVPPWEHDDSYTEYTSDDQPAPCNGPVLPLVVDIPESPPSEGSVPMEPVDDHWSNVQAPPIKKKGKKGTMKHMKQDKASLRARFDSRNYLPSPNPKEAITQQSAPQSNTAANQNFTPVLLAHARLYTFAESNMIDPLRALTLQKLHSTLREFQLFYGRVGDIVELAKYAYEHNLDRRDDGTVDDLRRLVVEYIACEIDIIGKSKAFKQLMEDGGELVGDVWDLVMMHLI